MQRTGIPVQFGLLAIATVVTVVLVWFGWRTIEQERDLERQRERELLERAADTAAAGIRGRLAEAGERLSRGEWTVWTGAAVVRLEGGRVAVAPGGVLPFVPVGDVEGVLETRVAEGESWEFGGQLARAAARYRETGGAEALLRLGRIRRKMRDEAGAAAAYRELAAMGSVPAGGVPAELAGWDGLGWRERIAEGVDGGRWVLTRGAAEFYRDRVGQRPKPANWALAEALASAWGNPGVRLVGGRVVVMWRASGAGAVGWMEELAGPFVPAGYRLAVGEGGEGVVRVVGDAAHPISVRIWREGAAAAGLRRGLWVGMLGLVIVFLWAAVCFMARAMRREAEAARLQSNFVASVSHEFRSPLTTVRQLAEMLEMGQVPSEERRARYYSVLAGEARRLQRLVETLLDFGRMEAGVERYRRDPVLVGSLVVRAVEEAGGWDRVLADGDAALAVTGDADALAVAVRNLVENALKYSDGEVKVRWGLERERVFVEVRDRGPGIPTDEQRRIFDKFVRGRAAAAGNVKGTGVGLAMVRQIVRAHGGEVELKSEAGDGSVFTVWLKEVE